VPLVLVAAVASGCTGGGSEDGKSDEPATALEVRVVTCAGRLAEDARAEMESEIGDTLSAYVVGGFLGDYPREDFVRAFEGFTSGAARDATEDIDLLTAARFAEADSVTATRLRARISCLVDRGDLVGASARVAFDFEAREPGAQRSEPFSLRGRLLLTPASGTWSVFGYDVSRDDVPASGAGS
jgi:hypothetical protein